jgi:hypothetical protein
MLLSALSSRHVRAWRFKNGVPKHTYVAGIGILLCGG